MTGKQTSLNRPRSLLALVLPQDGIQDELDDIISTAKSVTRAMATDLDVMDGLARMASPSPAHMLAAHSRQHVVRLVDELRNDQLLKDIAQMAQACVDITR